MAVKVFRSPAVIDVSAKDGTARVTSNARPIRVERFTADNVQDHDLLAAQVTRLSQDTADATAESRGDPLRGSRIYRGLVCGTGGAKVIINHNLGRRVFWRIVGWYGSGVVAAPALVSDELDLTGKKTDVNTLALRSYVGGVVDLAVS